MVESGIVSFADEVNCFIEIKTLFRRSRARFQSVNRMTKSNSISFETVPIGSFNRGGKPQIFGSFSGLTVFHCSPFFHPNDDQKGDLRQKKSWSFVNPCKGSEQTRNKGLPTSQNSPKSACQTEKRMLSGTLSDHFFAKNAMLLTNIQLPPTSR